MAVDLRKLILDTPTGIKEDDDEFKQQIDYRNLRKDLEDLKKEGWVRVVVSNKTNVLFPCDKNDKLIEVRQHFPQKSLAFLANIWDQTVSTTILADTYW